MKRQTLRTYAEEYLTSIGMDNTQIEGTLNILVRNQGPSDIDQPLSLYNDIFKNIFLNSVRQAGLMYINEICPDAWFRPVLELQ